MHGSSRRPSAIVTRERLERTRSLMDDAVRDWLVTGDADLVDSLTLPDPGDRHVLAAAIRAGTEIIVTYNLRDFPADALTAYGIEARHPDEFVARLLDVAPAAVTAAAKHQRQGLRTAPDRGRIPRDPGAARACSDGCRSSPVRRANMSPEARRVRCGVPEPRDAAWEFGMVSPRIPAKSEANVKPHATPPNIPGMLSPEPSVILSVRLV